MEEEHRNAGVSSSMPYSSRGFQPDYGLASSDGVIGMNPSEQAVDWQELLGHSGQVAIMRAVVSIDLYRSVSQPRK